jgi:hypothetical protein
MSESQPVKEVRISASDIVTALNKLLRAVEEQNKLVQTQNGILANLLKVSSGGKGLPTTPQVNPSQLGYSSMNAGGKKHIPGGLTGLEPPAWTGETETHKG